MRVRAFLSCVAIVTGCAPFSTGCGRAPARAWHEDFSDLAAWTAQPASDVRMTLSADPATAPIDSTTATAAAPAPEAAALRIDFSFGGGGWAIARCDVDLALPDNYAFAFWIRGDTAPQTLEFKLLDDTGENVWWSVRRDFAFGPDWQRVTLKKRDFTFAWGPHGEDELRRISAIEIAITASSGGAGTVWIDELVLDELPRPPAKPPRPRLSASSHQSGAPAEHALDGDPATAWSPRPDDPAPWLALDLRTAREFGGIVLDWDGDRCAPDYVVEISEDGRIWRTREAVQGANGGRDWLHLPDTEARWLRLRCTAPAGAALPADLALGEIALQPPDWAPRREDLFTAIAATHPRGAYPRAAVGEQSYWTVVGADPDDAESLMNEDGAIEVGPWQPSLEPFVEVGGRVHGWADVAGQCGLEQGDLPLPWVRWTLGDLLLEVRATPIGDGRDAAIVVRYGLVNHGAAALAPTLHLTVRPFQVNPPVQFLNRPGGIAPIGHLRVGADGIDLEGHRRVTLLDPPARFGASSFHGGDVVAEHLLRGSLPTDVEVVDPFAAASGIVSYPLALAPGDSATITLVLALHDGAELPTVTRTGDRAEARRALDEQVTASTAAWRRTLDRVRLRLPPSAQWIERTLRSQVAYVLVNRDGPAIQPGSRSYARSWIRDGALTSSALLRLGHVEPARAFLEWYAPHQFADGKIPCVVDARGGDPVPEHDSSGQFVFLVAELLRATGDVALAERMWPHVERAVAYLDSLRQLRRTAAYTADDQRVFFGLLPESISHEGYSAAPMHSYWDDFWALRGFRDAAWLAARLGHGQRQAHWEAVRAEFAADLARSVERALEVHAIDYVPGCADLGDFDATSTTIALSPTGAASILPPAAVRATFERYWDFFVQRRDGAPWDAYTPYELRNVGAFVHLGWRDRAHELLAWFREHQRPAGWNHWAEVVVHDERTSRFLGDMPHTWVGSDFVRAVLDMIAYVDADDALVLAAGVPAAWIDEAPGVEVTDLPTPFGRLDLRLRAREGTWEVRVGGDLQIPDGGVWLRLPLDHATAAVQIDGEDVATPTAQGLRITRVPATITVRR